MPDADPAIVFRRVLSGVDGSDAAQEAVAQSLRVGAEGATHLAVSAWDPSLAAHAGLSAGEFMTKLRADSQGALERVRKAFPEVRPLLMKGAPVPSLLAAAFDSHSDLVCVGSHGTSRAAGILFGSVASAVAHFAPCSVLIARPAPAGDFPGAILHANDGSPESLDAAGVAGSLASRYGGHVVTLNVDGSDNPGIAAAAVKLIESTGSEPVMETREGTAPRRIVELANQMHAGLIVMGSRGQTGLAALGSVSERVCHRATCSVLVVRRPSHPLAED